METNRSAGRRLNRHHEGAHLQKYAIPRAAKITAAHSASTNHLGLGTNTAVSTNTILSRNDVLANTRSAFAANNNAPVANIHTNPTRRIQGASTNKLAPNQAIPSMCSAPISG